MRLLKLDPIIQSGIRDGFVSMGHGRALVNIQNKEDQIAIYERIVAQGLSVRDTERAVRSRREGQSLSKGKTTSKIPEFVKNGTTEISKHLDASVAVTASEKGKGKISISFTSEEEFLRIKKAITGV